MKKKLAISAFIITVLIIFSTIILYPRKIF